MRFYEFISQIIDLDDPELEKFNVFARNLRPLLREDRQNEDIDLTGIELTHYRLKKQREYELKLGEEEGEYKIRPTDSIGTGKPHDPEKEALSEIIARLNEMFAEEHLSDNDRINFLGLHLLWWVPIWYFSGINDRPPQ